MEELINKIKTLKVTHQPVNDWDFTNEGKAIYKPRVEKLINLEDVILLLEKYNNGKEQ